MKSMDCLKSLGNPQVPSATSEQAPAEAWQRLEQLQLELRQEVVRAADDGDSFDSTERVVWDIVRRTGHAAMELLLSLQGSGDLGQEITTGEGRQLRRSGEPTATQVRSIFGEHSFQQFTYSAGANQKIELRPISTRL